MGVRLVWHGAKIRRALTERGLERLRNAAEELRDYIRGKVSTRYPPASRPGQYPHRRTGDFHRSIRYRVLKELRRMRVYSNDRKAKWLEYGTQRMAPRPTFRRALRENTRRLVAALRTKGRGEVRGRTR